MNLEKIKKILLDIISFNTSQAIVFNLTSIFIVLAAFPTEYLAYSPLKCVFKSYILPVLFRGHCPAAGIFAGCSCPACGMTRAMSRLLHGDLAGAYGFNKGVFVLFLAMVFVLVYNLGESVKYYKKQKLKRFTILK